MNSTYPYTWGEKLYKNSREFAKFKTKDGDPVNIHFTDSAINHVTQVIFYRDGRTEATGGGDAFKIFSTVIKTIYDYHKRYPNQGLAFEGDTEEPQRITLYSKLAAKSAKELGLQYKRVELEHSIGFVVAKPELLTSAVAQLEDLGHLEQ